GRPDFYRAGFAFRNPHTDTFRSFACADTDAHRLIRFFIDAWRGSPSVQADRSSSRPASECTPFSHRIAPSGESFSRMAGDLYQNITDHARHHRDPQYRAGWSITVFCPG